MRNWGNYFYKHKGVILLNISLFFFKVACTQSSNELLIGKWLTTVKVTGNKGTVGFLNSELEISRVSGVHFSGVIKNIWSEDSTVIALAPVFGTIYGKSLRWLRAKRVYAKDFPSYSNMYWIDCSNTDSSDLKLEQNADSLIIKVSNHKNLKKGCNNDVYYYKLKTASDGNIRVDSIYNFDSLKQGAIFLKRAIDLSIEKIVVKGDSAEIRLYDDGEIDGDKVSLMYNGKLLIQKLTLSAAPYIIKIPILKDRKNILVLYADNLGSKPPNTAFLRILCDGKEISINLSSDYEKSGAVEFVRSRSVIF